MHRRNPTGSSSFQQQLTRSRQSAIEEAPAFKQPSRLTSHSLISCRDSLFSGSCRDSLFSGGLGLLPSPATTVSDFDSDALSDEGSPVTVPGVLASSTWLLSPPLPPARWASSPTTAGDAAVSSADPLMLLPVPLPEATAEEDPAVGNERSAASFGMGAGGGGDIEERREDFFLPNAIPLVLTEPEAEPAASPAAAAEGGWRPRRRSLVAADDVAIAAATTAAADVDLAAAEEVAAPRPPPAAAVVLRPCRRHICGVWSSVQRLAEPQQREVSRLGDFFRQYRGG